MIFITIVGIIGAVISLAFILSELNRGINNLTRLKKNLTGIKRIQLLWLWPGALKDLLTDVIITLFIVWLFSAAGGQLGMIISFIASGMVSVNMWYKRRERCQHLR